MGSPPFFRKKKKSVWILSMTFYSAWPLCINTHGCSSHSTKVDSHKSKCVEHKCFLFFCCSHRFMCVFLMHVVQICMVQVWLIALANIYSWSTTLLILQMETLNTALVLCTILSNQVEQSMLYYYILLELSLLAIKCMLPLRLCMIKFHTCIDNKTAFSKHVVLVYQSLPATN